MLGAGRLINGFLHSWRQRVHALDVRGDRPQVLVFRPNSIGEHAGAANPVFGCPENLRLRKVCADHRQFGDRWEQNGTTLAERLARNAVTSGTCIAIEPSPCNQVRIGRRNRVRNIWRFASKRRVHSCVQERAFKRDGGISLRTSAKPNRMYPRTASVRTASVQNTPRRKYFILVLVQGIRLGPEC